MGINCGIVGLPNVGKSTLFNALTKAGIAAENYPFCTIEPNMGIVPIPDSRLDNIAAIVKPQKTVATTMEFVDIAGLVKGAAQGEGLGNQFLSHIREVDAIAHVVRCYENDDIVHVGGHINPERDIDIINTELCLADLATAEKAIQRVSKTAKSGNKEQKAQVALLEQILVHINENKPVRTFALNEEQQAFIKTLHFLTSKPTLYIANVAEDGLSNNPYLTQLEKIANAENAEVVPVCAAIESELIDLDAEEQLVFLREIGLEEPGLNRLIQASYRLLNLQTFFTAGVKEVRAWTVPIGSTAPKAASAIHTDFEKGFIRAEVIAYEDFITHNGEQGAKAAGAWRLEGKEYIVQDGDIMLFRFNV